MKQCETCRQVIEPVGRHVEAGHQSNDGHGTMWLGACGCQRKHWLAPEPSGEWRAYSVSSARFQPTLPDAPTG